MSSTITVVPFVESFFHLILQTNYPVCRPKLSDSWLESSSRIASNRCSKSGIVTGRFWAWHVDAVAASTEYNEFKSSPPAISPFGRPLAHSRALSPSLRISSAMSEDPESFKAVTGREFKTSVVFACGVRSVHAFVTYDTSLGPSWPCSCSLSQGSSTSLSSVLFLDRVGLHVMWRLLTWWGFSVESTWAFSVCKYLVRKIHLAFIPTARTYLTIHHLFVQGICQIKQFLGVVLPKIGTVSRNVPFVGAKGFTL